MIMWFIWILFSMTTKDYKITIKYQTVKLDKTNFSISIKYYSKLIYKNIVTIWTIIAYITFFFLKLYLKYLNLRNHYYGESLINNSTKKPKKITSKYILCKKQSFEYFYGNIPVIRPN